MQVNCDRQIFNARLAQLEEHLVYTENVGSSNLSPSTIYKNLMTNTFISRKTIGTSYLKKVYMMINNKDTFNQ